MINVIFERAPEEKLLQRMGDINIGKRVRIVLVLLQALEKKMRTLMHHYSSLKQLC